MNPTPARRGPTPRATPTSTENTSPMGLEKTPSRKFRDKLAREKYDRRAKRKSGPVVVRYVCPVCGGPHAKSECTNDKSPPPGQVPDDGL